MLKNHDFQNKLVFLLVFFGLLVFFFKVDFVIKLIPVELKYDTFLGILGNFAVAFYIASVISKKQKNNELKIDNCFKELDHLLCLINELRDCISKFKSKKEELEDIKIRYLSLISLQIQLVKNYTFISKEFNDKLDEHYRGLDKSLTGDNDIDCEKYKYFSLQLEKTILNVKSKIL